MKQDLLGLDAGTSRASPLPGYEPAEIFSESSQIYRSKMGV